MAINRTPIQNKPTAASVAPANAQSTSPSTSSLPANKIAGAVLPEQPSLADPPVKVVNEAESNPVATPVPAPATPEIKIVSEPGVTVPTLHPAVAVTGYGSVSASASAPVRDEDLAGILKRLNPLQRAKLRSAAMAEGLINTGTSAGTALGTRYRENPDGSLAVMIRVDRDLVPQLQTWAEEANKGIDDQVREIVDMLLSSYLLSPWEPPQPVGAPVAGAVAK